MNVQVEPELLQWARERASLDVPKLAQRMGFGGRTEPIEAWEDTGQLTYKQLLKLAEKTHVPVGYLFLPQPPDEHLPIRDFRTPKGGIVDRPSPELLDTIYMCQQRQDWLREYLITNREDRLPFVGSATLQQPATTVAAGIRTTLAIETNERTRARTWEQALSLFSEKAEQAGILVVRNGVVGNNTHRPLDQKEFRGFALADEYAPLIFLNGKDFLAAQIFTLAHELAHLWLGQSAVTDADTLRAPEEPIERYCNEVAAEVLVPEQELVAQWRTGDDAREQIQRLTHVFKVSTLVLLYRARNLDLITVVQLEAIHRDEVRQFEEKASSDTGGGGDFYNTQKSRLGRSFIRTLIVSTLQGETLYGDAYRLLGIKSQETFQKLVERFAI